MNIIEIQLIIFIWFLKNIETFLLAATLTVLIKYTIETYKLRKATFEHNELIIRPCLTLIKNFGKFISLENIGQGGAINILIEGVILPDVCLLNEKERGDVKISWPKIYKHIEAGGSILLGGEKYESKNKTLEKNIRELGPNNLDFPFIKLLGDSYDLNISYDDISYNRYVSKIHINCKLRRIKLIESYKIKNKKN